MILSFYQKNLRLNEELRKMLSEIIIEYMVQNKVYASPKIIEYISDGIVNIFKSEVKETYFINVPGKKPKGILYQKYHNTLTKLRRHQLWCPPKKVKKNSDVATLEEISTLQKITIINEDLIELKKWLQFYVEPISEVTSKWQKTCEIRRDYLLSQNINIADILDEWPILKQSFAYNLVIFYFIELKFFPTVYTK
uniref:Uncharacterized protein n=1 Tax=Sipha flava TaxID=143950 RepID=A0A2S2Q905_9HEMI